MRTASVLIALCFCVLLFTGCASCDKSCKCSKDSSCSCSKATGDSQTACACKELMAGGTGWCTACEKGFFEGKEVKCKGECAANPGGPPCEACVK